MSEPEHLKFDAFISYRHAELDNAVAGYLQKTLEHYRIPREIQKKTGKKRIDRIFRDEEELGASSDLFGQIEENLKQSAFLLVICSPRLSQSKWCLREIETFIRYHGRDKILAVLIEGEPEESFPEILTREGEPLAADLRGRDRREVLRHARQRIARLAAPLLGCTYDELYQRRKVYRMRRLALILGLVTCGSLAAGGFAFRQMLEIRKNYVAKQENQSRYLAKTSADLLESGDRETALAVALEALPEDMEHPERPYVAEARIALEQALYSYSMDRATDFRKPRGKMTPESKNLPFLLEADDEENVIFSADRDGRFYIWNGKTFRRQAVLDLSNRNPGTGTLTGGHGAVIAVEGGLLCWDWETNEIRWQWSIPEVTDPVLCSLPGQNAVLCADGSGEAGLTLYRIDAETGTARALELPVQAGEADGSLTGFTPSPDGEKVIFYTHHRAQEQPEDATLYDLTLWVADTRDGSILMRRSFRLDEAGDLEHSHYLGGAAWIDSDRFLLSQVEGCISPVLFVLPQPWTLSCIRADTGETLWEDRDSSVSTVGLTPRVQLVTDGEGPEPIAMLSVLMGNVAVNYHPDTGMRYARIEDRSSFVCTRVMNSEHQILVTRDGTVFDTSPVKNRVYDPSMSAMHYRLDLPDIQDAGWIRGKLLLETDTDLYCYGGWVDFSGQTLERRVRRTEFAPDRGHFLVQDAANVLNIWAPGGEEPTLCWQEQTASDPYSLWGGFQPASVLLGNTRAAWIEPEERSLLCRDFDGDGAWEIPIPGENLDGFALKAAGDDRLCVWYTESGGMSSLDPEQVLHLVNPEDRQVEGSLDFTTLWNALSPSQQEVFPLGETCMVLGEPVSATRENFMLIPLSLEQGMFATEEGQDARKETLLLRWDPADGEITRVPVTLPEADSTAVSGYAPCGGPECVCREQGLAAFYDPQAREIQVLDVRSLEIRHRIALEALGSREIAFSPDGRFLLFQDGVGTFLVYDLEKEAYTMMDQDSMGLMMDFSFWENGDILVASARKSDFFLAPTRLYRRTEPGTWELQTVIPGAAGCDGKTVVIGDEQYPRFYPVYGCDESIAMARDLLDGRELTDLERRLYCID